MTALTHTTPGGEVSMVDVSHKPLSLRTAAATGTLHLRPATLDLVEAGQLGKGNIWTTARLAGIMAAKRTGELVPLAHPLPISHAGVEFRVPPSRDRVEITASARIVSRTGVEMEALTAVTVAALTLYDMCKAVDDTMSIGDVRLLRKEKEPIGERCSGDDTPRNDDPA